MTDEPVPPVLPGETFGGKYRVERLLGRGGMGVVVAARHLDLEERVAIKFLVGEPSDDAVARFTREARAAVKVKGEHLCRVFDFGRLDSGEPYIVMEYLEGVDLAQKLEAEGPQPVAQVARWLVEICDALASAHSLGIVHRDLKPANVFLAKRSDGSTVAKVLDFGISKLPVPSSMTTSSMLMGSPAYMSPEQMESARDVDARADLWSLGALAYELLSGKPPFAADSMFELVVKVREQPPPPLAGVPPSFARVVVKCLEKNPNDRYATVADLVTDLLQHVPPDVADLAARLARTPVVDDTISASFSLPPPARDRSAQDSARPGVLSQALKTFDPVHSSVAASPSKSDRRVWPGIPLVLGTAALVIVGIKALRPEPVAGPSVDSSKVPTVEISSGALGVVDSASAPPPSRDETAPTETGPRVVASSGARRAVPVSRTPPPVAPAAAPSGSAASLEEAPKAPSVAPGAASSGPSASPPSPTLKRKRELDRDDP